MSAGCVCQKRAACLLPRCFNVEHFADKTESTCALHHGILPQRTMLFPACHSLPFSPWSLASQRTLFSTDIPSGMLLRSREENESLRGPDSQIEELSWTYEGSSQHSPPSGSQ